MLIREVKIIDARDLSEYAWAGLRRFQNVSFVEEQIHRLHKPSERYRQDVRKQATQIRQCLFQAKEYYDAASRVSLATKPTLYYYCIMSLALAEILLKQTGLSSLDKAREHHRHHGLELRADDPKNTTMSLRGAASCLRAAPLRIGGVGKGTFELWHFSSREMPIVGEYVTEISREITAASHRVILQAVDERLPLVPSSGLTLFECVRDLPGMYEFMNDHGITPGTLRGRLDAREPIRREHGWQVKLTLHPGESTDDFLDNALFHPSAVDRVELAAAGKGGIATWHNDPVFGNIRLKLPPGSMWTKDEVRFWPMDKPLNEFGLIYVALFISGNYARYYPDRWITDVERSTPLALCVEELIRTSEYRMPLLALTELTRIYQIPAS